MRLALQLLVAGSASGSLYAISAIGLVLVFRSSGVINFAHGAVAMVGGYLSWTLADAHGVPHILAIPVAIAGAAALGLLMYVVEMRHLDNASALTKVVATLAFFVIIQQAVLLIYGSTVKAPTAFLPEGRFIVGGVGIGYEELILFCFAVALTGALWWIYDRTRFGLATSAVAESPRTLAGLGWKVGRLRAANWAIGGALGGVAGVALAPILDLQPQTFALLITPMLATAVLGGLRSFPLTLLGGLLVGILQAECGYYIHVTGAGEAVPFLVIVVALVFFGRSLPLRSHINERLPRVGGGRVPWALVVVGAALLTYAAFNFSLDLVAGLTISVTVATVLISQVVITGYTGQLSLAQLPIAGVGALVAGHAVADLHVSFLVALLIGGFVAIPIGLAVGLPSMRARGASLAIATLGFGAAINAVILQNNKLNGGATGINVGSPHLFGLDLSSILYPERYVLFAAVILALVGYLVANLRRGRAGRRMLAVRTNERAAASLGVNVAATKLSAFVLAAWIAGIGGVLIAFQYPALTFTSYNVLNSINALIQSAIGGVGYVGGALIGGAGQNGGFMTALVNTWLFNLIQYFSLVLALGLLAGLVKGPDGVADLMSRNPGLVRRRLQALVARYRPRPEVRRRESITRQLVEARAESAEEGYGGHLVARDIRVRFGKVVAVDGVSLEVRPGEIVSVIGPNGAGKTTMMDAISGFVKAEGSVELDGSPLAGLPPHRRARAGLLRSFQSLELLEDVTVLDNLRCAADPDDPGALLADLVHPERDRIGAGTVAAIDMFELEGDLLRLPPELAHGTRHLVAVARVVAARPRVLMLDEPAAGLSEHERDELAALIRTMAKDRNVAILLVEHSVDLVRSVSDRVVALDFGRQIASGTPEEVLSDPAVVAAYLGGAIGTHTVAQASTEVHG